VSASMYESRGYRELLDETLAFRVEVSAIIFRNVPLDHASLGYEFCEHASSNLQ